MSYSVHFSFFTFFIDFVILKFVMPLPTEVSTAVVTEFEEITHGRSIYNEVKIRIKPGLQTRYSEKNS